MPRAVAFALVGLLASAACSDVAAPIPSDDFELPAPDTSLDPDRLVIGEYIATPCAFGQFGNGLTHLRDRVEWALVDVHFGRASASDPADGPKEEDLNLVRAHGGRILHVFNVPAARVRILLSRIPGVVLEGNWVTVREVPDMTRYDLELFVGFHSELEDAHLELVAELGGRVTHRYELINAVAAIVPDRSIPELRANHEVEYVESSGVACLG